MKKFLMITATILLLMTYNKVNAQTGTTSNTGMRDLAKEERNKQIVLACMRSDMAGNDSDLIFFDKNTVFRKYNGVEDNAGWYVWKR